MLELRADFHSPSQRPLAALRDPDLADSQAVRRVLLSEALAVKEGSPSPFPHLAQAEKVLDLHSAGSAAGSAAGSVAVSQPQEPAVLVLAVWYIRTSS